MYSNDTTDKKIFHFSVRSFGAALVLLLIAALPAQATVFTVTNTNDTGPGSLREAMFSAVITPGKDSIYFNIAGGGPQTITPQTPLQQQAGAIVIDGSTQPGFSGQPLIRIDYSNVGTGIYVGASNGTEIAWLDIFTSSNTSSGIRFDQDTNSVAHDNIITGFGHSIATYDGRNNSFFNNRCSQAAANSNVGIYVVSGQGFSVKANDFSQTSLAIRLEDVSNYIVEPDSGNVFPTTNVLMVLKNCDQITVRGFHDTTPATTNGFQVESSTNCLFSGNTISNKTNAVLIWGPTTSTVTFDCNEFNGNSSGVVVSSGSHALTLTNNVLSGNGNAIANYGTIVTNASNNYWGAPSGPSNLGGSGDAYVGPVTASPFLTAAPACAGSNPPLQACLGEVLTFTPADTFQTAYNWDFGDGNNSNAMIATHAFASTGNFQVVLTVTDTNGCLATDTSNVEIGQVVITGIASTDNACFGDNSGTATANATGGFAPLTYAWSNGGTTGAITGLSGGTYILTVTDAAGCTDIDSVTILEPTQLLASASLGNHVSCNGASDGQATVSASGGTPPLAYVWSDGQTTATASNLNGGSYSVTVTDANGCSAIDNISINEPPALVLTLNNTGPVCAGGTTADATAIVTGGTPAYNYLWSDGQSTATATGLLPGAASITVTDANGCTVSGTTTINAFPATSATFSVTR